MKASQQYDKVLKKYSAHEKKKKILAHVRTKQMRQENYKTRRERGEIDMRKKEILEEK